MDAGGKGIFEDGVTRWGGPRQRGISKTSQVSGSILSSTTKKFGYSVKRNPKETKFQGLYK